MAHGCKLRRQIHIPPRECHGQNRTTGDVGNGPVAVRQAPHPGNRIGPSGAELFIANADGTSEHKLLSSPGFDYNASFSPDGQWIVFTSERSGQADLYRVRVDGTGLEQLTDNPASDDQAAFSPDGNHLAFVSSRGSGSTDIWIL